MNAIEVNHLSKSFGSYQALQDVSFTVKQGEVFGLLGPNGAGKTTALRMLTTLLKPSSGTVEIFGHDTATDGQAARQMFGLTGQYATVDEDLTARQNLMIFSKLNGLFGAEAKHRTNELIEEFSLKKSADKSIKSFSGGMRRRLDLAISLITRPAIIFLDEPTTGLDPRTRKQMWTTIRELVASGSTIMLTTQYLDEADQLADRVAVIDHGKLIKIGSPSELKKQVGNSSLCLTFATDETTHKAIPIIEQQLRTTATTDHTSLSVPLKNTSEITSLLDKLQAKNIAITSINVEEPTLDDVFMQLTVGTN